MPAHALTLHYAYYNPAKIHQPLTMTSAMAADVNYVWSVEEIVALLGYAREPAPEG